MCFPWTIVAIYTIALWEPSLGLFNPNFDPGHWETPTRGCEMAWDCACTVSCEMVLVVSQCHQSHLDHNDKVYRALARPQRGPRFLHTC